MKTLFGYLYKGQKLRFVSTLFLVTASSLFEVMLAYVMMRCVDLASEGSLQEASSFALWLVLYLATYFILDYVANKLKWKTLQNAQTNLRDDIVQKLLSMPVKLFHKKNTGSRISMLTSQCDMIEESYMEIWFSVFSELFTFFVSAIVLLYISPWLAVFVFVVAFVQLLIPKIMGPKIAERKSEQMRNAELFTVTATEHLNGFDLLKSFDLTSQSLHSISEANRQWETSKFKSRILSSTARLLSFTFGQILYVGIFFFGAMLTILGVMTVSKMIVASQLVVYIAAPLQTLGEDITELKSAVQLIRTLQKELLYSEKQVMEFEQFPATFREMDFKDVSFSYADIPIFDKINATIVRGEKYLLCGPSGSGKSTFIKLLTGIEDPDRGRVCIDGIDIRNLDTRQLANFILPCTQSTFIFNASVRDNVTLFNKRFSDEEILDALQKIEFTYVLQRYKDGLNHVITQGGQSLSGGERQKIALARMELFNPSIVTFDESFANLDTETARRLMEVAVSKKERTVIVVAHQMPQNMGHLFHKRIVIDGTSVNIEG
ncbi:ABC transporter ATP-binding protein [Filifactor villosus]|uniref:ABC transporter ATP-binding protein n=1 Tax=Filifactor villosus TaxID=29374 RepID=A0ABV9QMW6_9FIRM